MLGERIASQSEVIRAIVPGYNPRCGVPHLLALDGLKALCGPGLTVRLHRLAQKHPGPSQCVVQPANMGR